MLSLVATIKPKDLKGWSAYWRIELKDSGADPDDYIIGTWHTLHSTINSNIDHGVWGYDKGIIGLFSGDTKADSLGLVLMNVHWNFRVIYSHTQCTGPGRSQYLPGHEQLVWVIGPGIAPSRKLTVIKDPFHQPVGDNGIEILPAAVYKSAFGGYM